MGAVPKESTRRYQIQTLQDNHREILRQLSLGQKPAVIAKELGVTSVTVSNVRNSELGRLKLNDLNGEDDDHTKKARARILELLPKSVEVLEKAMDQFVKDDIDGNLALRSAREALHISGLKPPTVIRSSHVGVEGKLTSDDIKALMDRAAASRREMVSDEPLEVEAQEC